MQLLQARNLTCDTILKIAKLPKRVYNNLEPVDEKMQEDNIADPSMKKVLLPITNKPQYLIISPYIIQFNIEEITTDVLQHYSNLPKNVRFQNKGNYYCNLQLNFNINLRLHITYFIPICY